MIQQKSDKNPASVPGILIAAPFSGSGKTTFTTGLLAALKKRTRSLYSYKCGPDYIDPMYHTRVLGIPCRNLDTWFTGEEKLKELQDGRVLPLSHALFDERDALVFAGLNSRSVDLVHRESGHGLRFDFPKMEVLAVWSMPKKNADYVCLEPWHGIPGRVQDSDNFEDKPYVTLLDPGRVYTTWFTVTLI